MVRASIFLSAAAFAAALALGTARTTGASPVTCWSGYSYVGGEGTSTAYGVSATLTLMQASVVTAGHVAAWIGFGGAGMGPGGTDEWVQAGIAEDAGGADRLYYEFRQPQAPRATYVQLGVVRPGERHSIAVYERHDHPGSWRVSIDGRTVGAPVLLPGSHGAFRAVATAENWDGGEGICNDYSFRFATLAVERRDGGDWRPFTLARVLHDPAYVLRVRPSGFVASSR